MKWRSSYYDYLGGSFGFGRADLMCSLALFDDDPNLLSTFEPNIMRMTSDDLQRVARDYLRSTNRTSLVLATGTEEESDDA